MTIRLLPDATRALLVWAANDDDVSAVVKDFGTELADDPIFPALVVKRLGGLRRRDLDRPIMQFEIWGDDSTATEDEGAESLTWRAIETVRRALDRLKNTAVDGQGFVTFFDEVSGPQSAQDPTTGRPRWVLRAEFRIRPV